jgi:hypothetical protein
MTDTQTPPDWILIEAAKRGGRHATVEEMCMIYQADKTFRALCDMIERHEEPPVDRKVLCAREAIEDISPRFPPLSWGDQSGVIEAAVRAIELYEGGFGE